MAAHTWRRVRTGYYCNTTSYYTIAFLWTRLIAATGTATVASVQEAQLLVYYTICIMSMDEAYRWDGYTDRRLRTGASEFLV
jgi:hypothetical protein